MLLLLDVPRVRALFATGPAPVTAAQDLPADLLHVQFVVRAHDGGRCHGGRAVPRPLGHHRGRSRGSRRRSRSHRRRGRRFRIRLAVDQTAVAVSPLSSSSSSNMKCLPNNRLLNVHATTAVSVTYVRTTYDAVIIDVHEQKILWKIAE